ncbi:PAS domain-containing protein [Sporosarcina oncorhynchi]|uniref:PAS domain-containing protein n=1 Tax=Sporosarcina oncorhynchi TaxID=3056444 RepID=A0ABZ0L4K4_9BACL|nr:PAS domain-containing protein [Sporosarcina sp. T2O-4]WOV87517.1 PAS domain-containing protein [Sporosarcina sp. T2O-4]
MNKLPDSIQVELLTAMLDGSQVAALVTDPSQSDNPIIFANQTFEKLTGYSMDETVGRNCRFLQGESTDTASIEIIRNAITDKRPVMMTLLNYKKDGTPFWNRLSIKPLEIQGKLFFIGTQTDVSLVQIQQKKIYEKEQEIEQLTVPILMIQQNLAAISLIGRMSHERVESLCKKLSEFVEREPVDNIVIDISGLVWEESSSLGGLHIVQNVLKLMGTQLYVTGISPKIAQSLAMGGESGDQLTTFATIRHAIENIK